MTLYLRIQARFAAFRWMQAGVYRATSPVIPPSAAWGLVLNLAHIDTRDPATYTAVTTGIRPDAPRLCLAVGIVEPSEIATLYQQLHSYPVGNSGKELAPRTRGSKYWIAPVRRELLVNFHNVIGVRSPDSALLDRIAAGLRGQLTEPRYGLPFAGDNNFLFDRIDIDKQPPPARWYTRVAATQTPPRGSCRLTVAIDRSDQSRTESRLFAPTELTPEPPEDAWTWCPCPPQAAP